jgi:hypothetical protein
MQATTRRWGAALALTATVALAACGGHDDKPAAPVEGPGGLALSAGPETPRCDDLFVDGATITSREWNAGCKADDGSFVVSTAIGYDCGTAWENDFGWGYEGGKFHAGAEMPGLDVLSKCGGGE